MKFVNPTTQKDFENIPIERKLEYLEKLTWLTEEEKEKIKKKWKDLVKNIMI